MSAYSIEGYGVALALRSKKTILVEGVSDKRVLARLILQHDIRNQSQTNVLIDEVGLVSNDNLLSGKGHKERIRIIANSLERLSHRFNWLIDREWDEMDLQANPIQLNEVQPALWGRKTKGHSIENYWFGHRFLSEYLQIFYGDQLSAAYFDALVERFDGIIRIAAAYSFASKRFETISRSVGMLKASHVRWLGGQYIAHESLSAELQGRYCRVDIANEVNSELNRRSLQEASTAILQWLCHGHLGEEMIRACAANLAAEFGSNGDVVTGIERGKRAELVAHASHRLAELDIGHAAPLGDLITWVNN